MEPDSVEICSISQDTESHVLLGSESPVLLGYLVGIFAGFPASAIFQELGMIKIMEFL